MNAPEAASQALFLAPGFLISLIEKRQTVMFSQLNGRLKRAALGRLALVDELNRGYRGTYEQLIFDIAEKHDARRPAIREFLNVLNAAGYVLRNAPEKRFHEEEQGRRGSPGDGPLVVSTPTNLMTQDGHYLWFDHEGTLLLRLNLAELMAVTMFNQPVSVADAREQYIESAGAAGLTRAEFDDLVERVAGAELFSAPRVQNPDAISRMAAPVDVAEIQSLIDERIAAHDEDVRKSGKSLVQVVPVNTQAGTTPASLGLLMAYAMDYEGGRLKDRYDFVPMFLIDEERIVARGATPGIFIFSNYIWTVDANLALSAAVKAVNPANITIHGGPSTPSYEKDCEQFFIDNPHVDICVRGEGELTFSEILDKVDVEASSALIALHDVDGLSFRTDTGVVRTGDRARIADIDSIPSPYLTGLFDEFGSVRAGAVIETNRGCPYGCTFCDWGSATLSKVRRFDLDRVFAELEWSARHQIEDASIADANFGMLERDVAVTEKIAALKREHGYPRSVGINYAKNQVKYLRDIIRIMADVEILTEGKVSLQSMDETTLQVIDRSNIKLSKYNELASEFRRAKLPLAVEIMIGLPGATVAAFRNDLQECTNRDVRVMLNTTTLLPNSPMNAPEYREEHGIVALPGEVLTETASYTREEWEHMNELKMAYYLLDSYGLMRYVARFVRRETGMGEVGFYVAVMSEVSRNPQKWPVISDILSTLESYMAPPGTWAHYLDEVKRFLVDILQLPEDTAMETTLAVQHAHLPASYREFPFQLELAHDFAAWWNTLLEAREDGHRDDWEKHTPRLTDFGPASLTVDDPNGVCITEIGKPLNYLLYSLRSWELDSPVARPRAGASYAAWS
ncbi:MAG: radical SAM protein [Halioglobus sp.]